MRMLGNHVRLSLTLAGLLAAGLTGILAPAAAAAAKSSAMPEMDGWIRLAHLSPNTPAVDVYLYPFSGSHAKVVLHHVPYGTVHRYLKVAPGEYTVAMRVAGKAPSSPPVLSATVHVKADRAYTVAGMGTAHGVALKVLPDRIMTPKGKILIRVIQASQRHHMVTVTAGKQVLAGDLAFGKLSSYQVANPGMWNFRAVSGGEQATQTIKLVPNCIHTIVILDKNGSLKIDDLLDTAGAMKMPMGGVQTGLGGTAAHPDSAAVPWLASVGVGGLLALAGGITIRRARRRPAHAR